MLSADIKNNNIKLFIDVEKTMPSKKYSEQFNAIRHYIYEKTWVINQNLLNLQISTEDLRSSAFLCVSFVFSFPP